MTTFNERERAFEEKFAHDREVRFRVHALRNRLFGLWVAQKLQLRPAAAEFYATALAQADVAKFCDDEIVNKILGDFSVHGQAVSEAEIRAQLALLLPVAKRQIGDVV